MPQISEIEVTYLLPEWICNHDYVQPHFYPSDHAYTGQIRSESFENHVFNRLYEELEWSEVCTDAAGPWIRVKVGSGMAHPALPAIIRRIQGEIATILDEFEEKPCKD